MEALTSLSFFERKLISIRLFQVNNRTSVWIMKFIMFFSHFVDYITFICTYIYFHFILWNVDSLAVLNQATQKVVDGPAGYVCISFQIYRWGALFFHVCHLIYSRLFFNVTQSGSDGKIEENAFSAPTKGSNFRRRFFPFFPSSLIIIFFIRSAKMAWNL